jgi:hypothetical protein
MYKNISPVIVIMILALMTSCASKKLDYATAYKFKVQKMYTAEEVIKLDYLTSNDDDIQSLSSEATMPLSFKSQEDNKAFSQKENIVENSKSTKMQKRFSRREKKIEKRMEKASNEKFTSSKSKSVNSKVYTGIVVGGAGLILAILFGGTLGLIGGVAVLVGLIFIVWGLLE